MRLGNQMSIRKIHLVTIGRKFEIFSRNSTMARWGWAGQRRHGHGWLLLSSDVAIAVLYRRGLMVFGDFSSRLCGGLVPLCCRCTAFHSGKLRTQAWILESRENWVIRRWACFIGLGPMRNNNFCYCARRSHALMQLIFVYMKTVQSRFNWVYLVVMSS